jgi:FdhE protein
MPVASSSDSGALLVRLERRIALLRQQRPELGDALALQGRIVSTQMSSPRAPALSAFALPRQLVAARVREGVPLLHDQPAVVDVQFAAELFGSLVTALSPRFDPVAGALASGRVDPEHLFGEAFVQHSDHLRQIAGAAGEDAELLSAVATLAVAPVLRAYAAKLGPLLAAPDGQATSDGLTAPDGQASSDGKATSWTQGYCPICGGCPLLGELRGTDLVAWLRCGACGFGWQVQRGACPFCGNDDEQQLGTLTLEAEQRFRAVVCQRCRTYLKVGNALEPPPTEVLAIDDVLSLHLDVAAAERGYRRASGTGYRIELAVPETEDWLEELE